MFGVAGVGQSDDAFARVKTVHGPCIVGVQLKIENAHILQETIFIHRLWYRHRAQLNLLIFVRGKARIIRL